VPRFLFASYFYQMVVEDTNNFLPRVSKMRFVRRGKPWKPALEIEVPICSLVKPITAKQLSKISIDLR
jgi:hypothetical protein